MSVFYELLSFFVRLVLGKLRDLDHFLEFGCVYSWIEFSELAGDVYVSSKKKKKNPVKVSKGAMKTIREEKVTMIKLVLIFVFVVLVKLIPRITYRVCEQFG